MNPQAIRVLIGIGIIVLTELSRHYKVPKDKRTDT